MNNLRATIIIVALLVFLSSPVWGWGVTIVGSGSPVVAGACSGTLGNSSTTDTGYDALAANRLLITKISVACTGTPSTINFRTKYLNGSVKFVIYSDEGTEPGTLLYTSAAVACGNPSGVTTISDSACDYELTENSYYVGIVSEVSGRAYYSSATGGTTFIATPEGAYTTPPTSWPTATDTPLETDAEIWLTF